MAYITIDQAPPNEGEFKLGLEQEGLNSYPTSSNTFEIPQINGEFKHGLTDEQLEFVEKAYGRSFSNPDDRLFWSNFSFDLKNYLQTVDMQNPEHVLMMGSARQLGYCAGNMEEVEANPLHQYIYVINDKNAQFERKLSLYEKQDEAIVVLDRVKKNSKKRLIALAYMSTPNPSEIGTNDRTAYTRLRELIDGKYNKTKIEGINAFNRVVELDPERLYCQVDVERSIRKNIIRRNGKGHYYNPLSDVEYGRSKDAIVDFLLNPKNQDEYGGIPDAPAYSIISQLKKSEL